MKIRKDEEQIDSLIERAFVNTDTLFFNIKALAKYHSKSAGEEFSRFKECDMPRLGLFKDNEDEYRLILPPFRSIQYKRTSTYRSVVISELVKDCCSSYEKKNGVKLIPETKYARVTITNYVKKRRTV